jgi:hypothetical protein
MFCIGFSTIINDLAMRKRQPNAIKSVRRRLEVGQALSRYPDLPSEQIQDLVHWFKREATAMEVATVANSLDAKDQDSYRQFRQAHIDRLTPVELAVTTLFGATVIVCFAVGVAIL